MNCHSQISSKEKAMTSSFAWVDFSEDDRDRMNKIMRLFAEKDTLDELGIGAVRDAIADHLFPGTSTIQTRARYFFFVPWIYLRHEKRKTLSNEISNRAHNDEIKLIEVLLNTSDTDGVIGKDARSALQTLPSNIYWAGLGRFDIRRFDGSQDEYHRGFSSRLRLVADAVDGDDEDAPKPIRRNWDPNLPAAPQDFPNTAELALTSNEAEYLAMRIDALQPRPLFSLLIRKLGPFGNAAVPWLHPDVGALGEPYRSQLEHARNFSETLHGASLLYNLMLAEALGSKEYIEQYRTAFTEWAQDLSARRAAIMGWDQLKFWDFVNESESRSDRSRPFIDKWLAITLKSADPSLILENNEARKLIREREWDTKQNRARLHNRRALERWRGATGASQLNFRWHRVRAIVGDVRRGLGKEP